VTIAKTGETILTTPSDREVAMTRVFDAPRDLVFEAFTRPEHMQRWMLGPEGWEMPVCESDLRAGGAWRRVWRKADGEEMEMTGAYREVEPPVRVVSTESWGEGWPETVNTIELAEEHGRTTVTLTVLYPSQKASDAATETGMAEGANASYARLDELLRELAGAGR